MSSSVGRSDQEAVEKDQARSSAPWLESSPVRPFQGRMDITVAIMMMVLVALQIVMEILGLYKDTRDDRDDDAAVN